MNHNKIVFRIKMKDTDWNSWIWMKLDWFTKNMIHDWNQIIYWFNIGFMNSMIINKFTLLWMDSLLETRKIDSEWYQIK